MWWAGECRRASHDALEELGDRPIPLVSLVNPMAQFGNQCALDQVLIHDPRVIPGVDATGTPSIKDAM